MWYVLVPFPSFLYGPSYLFELIDESGTAARESRQLQRQAGEEPSLPADDYVQFCGGPSPDWERQGKEPGKLVTERVDAKVRSLL